MQEKAEQQTGKNQTHLQSNKAYKKAEPICKRRKLNLTAKESKSDSKSNQKSMKSQYVNSKYHQKPIESEHAT